MGNQHSSSSGSGSRRVSEARQLSHAIPNFRRSTGALGLSKSELDKRCKPSGLYPSCQWEDRAIRRLVGDGKIAARLRGTDSRSSPTDRECPICFLQYPQVNITHCCQATVCTECYLQIRPQKEKSCSCPFCNNPKLLVSVAKQLGASDVQKREEEEQKVIEATIRARANTATSTDSDLSGDGGLSPSSSSASAVSPLPSGFGASLERHSSFRRLNQARSESMSSSFDEGSCAGSDLSSVAMSVEERRALEEEMRAQNFHPLTLRMEAEAEERRFQNQRDYYRGNTHRLRHSRLAEDMLLRARAAGGSRRDRFSRMTSDSRLLSSSALGGRRYGGSDSAGAAGGSSGRDWNQIVDAFEGGGNGEVQTLDDLVVIEAAILLSMEEEAARRRAHRGRRDQGDLTSEDEDDDEDGAFDPAEHARTGFPLLQAIMARRAQEARNYNEENNDEDDETSEDGSINRNRLATTPFARRGSLRGSRRAHLIRSARIPSSTHIGSAGMLMRGVTEEEQIAMAIALSLREAEAAQQQNNSGGVARVSEEAESAEEDSERAAESNETVDGEEATGGTEQNSGEPGTGNITNDRRGSTGNGGSEGHQEVEETANQQVASNNGTNAVECLEDLLSSTVDPGSASSEAVSSNSSSVEVVAVDGGNDRGNM